MAEQRAPFPTDSDDFAADSRISYSKTSQTFLLEDEHGEEWEWLAGPQKWSKVMDEALMKQQAEIYKVAGVDEDAPALNPAQKRKQALLEDPDTNPKNAKADAKAATPATATAAAKPRPNSAIFVTGLPKDVDEKEVRDYFKKFGIIAESVGDDEKRIRLYNGPDGVFKGEALIIYHRPESIPIAIEMADGAYFPREEASAPTSQITVTEASRDFKANKDDTVAPERPKAKPQNRAQVKKKAQEMDSRLADWSDDDMPAKPQASTRPLKVVIIKNLFTFDVIKKDPEFLEDCYLDMQEEAEAIGTVKNVTLFDLEPQGIATVRFSDAEKAEQFSKAVAGRGYDGRVLETFLSDGSEKFKKTRKAFVDKEAEEAKRLEEYSKFIEGKDGDADGSAST